MRRWAGVAATLVVMTVTVLGGFVFAGAVPREIEAPVVVGGSVRVFPLSGWTPSAEGAVGDLTGVRISRGTAALDVLTRLTDLGSEAVLVRYVERFLRPESRSLSVSREVREVPVAGGLTGLRESYLGTFGDRMAEVEGELTVVVSPSGVAVVFDAWAPSGRFGYAVADTREMVRTAEIA